MASDKRRTGYYAHRAWVPLTQESELRSLESLAHQQVRYIVLDDRVLGDLDALLPSPGFALRELYRSTAEGRSAMVYELARDPGFTKPPASVSIGAGPQGRD